jgi:hypothetical protein
MHANVVHHSAVTDYVAEVLRQQGMRTPEAARHADGRPTVGRFVLLCLGHCRCTARRGAHQPRHRYRSEDGGRIVVELFEWHVILCRKKWVRDESTTLVCYFFAHTRMDGCGKKSWQKKTNTSETKSQSV